MDVEGHFSERDHEHSKGLKLLLLDVDRRYISDMVGAACGETWSLECQSSQLTEEGVESTNSRQFSLTT